MSEIKTSITIGRSATNEFVLEDRTVSRKHAEITRLDNGRFRLVDHGSANGTFVSVDGTFHRVLETEVGGDDIVRFGDREFTVKGVIERSQTHSAARRRRKPAAAKKKPVAKEAKPSEGLPLNPLAEVRPTERLRAADAPTAAGDAAGQPGEAAPPRATATADAAEPAPRPKGDALMIGLGLGAAIIVTALIVVIAINL